MNLSYLQSLPSNSLVVRRADLEDPERLDFLKKYLRGWAMGSEFAERNPRAAADIVFKALPSTKANYGARAGLESLMQIHRTFSGDIASRAGWGEHNIPAWDDFFKILKTIGQSSIDIDTGRYVTNEFIAEANDFDKAKVHADADAYALPDDLAAIDMADVEANVYNNVITGRSRADQARIHLAGAQPPRTPASL